MDKQLINSNQLPGVFGVDARFRAATSALRRPNMGFTVGYSIARDMDVVW